MPEKINKNAKGESKIEQVEAANVSWAFVPRGTVTVPILQV